MEREYIDDGVRTRLIIAGISELEEHGIKDFSLRRAALSAQVSCAAPYRHFKDKDEFITEIIKYVVSKWELLCREIIRVFSNDKRRLIVEIAVASVRFWLANPNFRSVIALVPVGAEMGAALASFDASLNLVIEDYLSECNLLNLKEQKQYTTRAVIYGTVMLIGRGEIANAEETFAFLRKKIEEEFSF